MAGRRLPVKAPVRAKTTPPADRHLAVIKPAPLADAKHSKWMKLLSLRLAKARYELRGLHKLFDREYYDFSEQERLQVISTLRTEVDDIEYASLNNGLVIKPLSL